MNCMTFLYFSLDQNSQSLIITTVETHIINIQNIANNIKYYLQGYSKMLQRNIFNILFMPNDIFFCNLFSSTFNRLSLETGIRRILVIDRTPATLTLPSGR